MPSCAHTLNKCTRQRALRFAAFNSRQSLSSWGLPAQLRKYASISAAELQFGQPLHETHPHILKAGELTPGITSVEYAQRRAALAAKLPKNAIAILAASEIKYRSGAVFYEFHQDSNFFYLTGFNEPEAVAVIGVNGDDHKFHLYVREKDAKAEQWDGVRSGTHAALDIFNADETGDIKQVSSLLTPIVTEASKVYTDLISKPKNVSLFSRFLHDKPSKDEGLAKILQSSNNLPLNDVINEVRNLKSDAEIANMRKAGQASGRAYTDAMRRPWAKEKDLAAYLDYQFKMRGCDSSAYIPVVAGGQNASVIHYTQNDHVLKNGQMVLVDAGGEYGGYITDITRTWPISGAFTPAQRDLYNAVLTTQRQCISLCRANANVSLDELHNITEKALKDQLQQLGFDMSGNALETLFPHHLGHYIGLDVHDTPGQSRKTKLQPRQCVTIEPGLYIPNTEAYPAHFRGMGIRIEDSVCVQEEHPFVLTTEAVKEVDDIEALRS
ncbi:putative metallopeptidase family M24 [Usnea florida]